MKPTARGFVGMRLREAREARGLTATALAEILGVTRAAVSQYETGRATPRPEILEGISKVLNFPPHFFVRPLNQASVPKIFYRSISTATKTVRTMAERRLMWLSEEVVPYLSNFVELPAVNIPNVPLPSDPLRLSETQIEDAAATVRESWHLGSGPIGNVVWLLEGNGVIVTRGELEAEGLDSFCGWLDGRPYLFLNADKHSAVRSRFDAAHELAHLIMHRHVERKRLGRTVDHSILEQQAHRFAGAFLLPAKAFMDDVYMPTLDALRALKPKWRVSIGMMIMRAQHLELITDQQARRLWVAYSRRGWKRGEPLDRDLPIEEPQLQRAAFKLLIEEHVQTPDDILLNLPYPATDVEALAGLPPGYITELPPPVRLLEFPAQRREVTQQRSTARGEVVAFPERRKRE